MITSLMLGSVLLCTPITGIDAKTVAYLVGEYRVLGYHHNTGLPYTGLLSLSGDEDAEVLTVSGETAGGKFQGSARYMRCGPDDVRQLEVTIDTDANVMYCVPHRDYSNLSRVTCSRWLSESDGDIEVWYQYFAH
jgi:hypothetical protein